MGRLGDSLRRHALRDHSRRTPHTSFLSLSRASVQGFHVQRRKAENAANSAWALRAAPKCRTADATALSKRARAAAWATAASRSVAGVGVGSAVLRALGLVGELSAAPATAGAPRAQQILGKVALSPGTRWRRPAQPRGPPARPSQQLLCPEVLVCAVTSFARAPIGQALQMLQMLHAQAVLGKARRRAQGEPRACSGAIARS